MSQRPGMFRSYPQAFGFLALALLTNTAILAGLYGCWTLSQSVARGLAFPTIPHAETGR